MDPRYSFDGDFTLTNEQLVSAVAPDARTAGGGNQQGEVRRDELDLKRQIREGREHPQPLLRRH